MSAIDILELAEKAVGLWPQPMPGHVNFGAEAIDVDGQLEDGAHRQDGSAWQFVVEGGKIVTAVREDLVAWWRADHTVYGDGYTRQAEEAVRGAENNPEPTGLLTVEQGQEVAPPPSPVEPAPRNVRSRVAPQPPGTPAA